MPVIEAEIEPEIIDSSPDPSCGADDMVTCSVDARQAG
jgi:hypothetical protein